MVRLITTDLPADMPFLIQATASFFHQESLLEGGQEGTPPTRHHVKL